ncbi:hypothetical protein BU15DRAFT_62811 [Melanogaster broomeanus]|nr:hypothetical protein BU15DRAFT_62811 [Melanogaster broomeanus]
MASKQAHLDTLLLKSLLGEELIHTEFYLFSSRSCRKKTIGNPRVLCINNVIAAQSSDYFAKLLNKEEGFSDTGVFDLEGSHRPDDGIISFGDYGYEDDSDLDDEDEEIGRDMETIASTDVHDSEDEHLRYLEEELNSGIGQPVKQTSSSYLVGADLASGVLIAHPLRPIESSRHILVKDTAFRTWKALLFYLYTGRVTFHNLKSQGKVLTQALDCTDDPPNCSPKSMYRLACKVGLESLASEALKGIRERLTKNNIIHELGLVLPSRYPQILEAELDTLFRNIDSEPVVSAIPSLFASIAKDQIPHGAAIMTGLYQRVLKTHYTPRDEEAALSSGFINCCTGLNVQHPDPSRRRLGNARRN